MGSHRPGHSTHARPAQSALPSPSTDSSDPDSELRAALRQSAEQLRVTYCVVATTERVLRGRSYEEDRELAGWLRWGVLDPLGREIERLSCRLVQLGGNAVLLP